MQESLSHTEGKALVVVGTDAYLPDELLLSRPQLTVAERVFAEVLELFQHKLYASLSVMMVTSEVDAEGTRVSVGRVAGFYLINESAVFTQGDVEATVHTWASKQVIDEVEGNTFGALATIGSSTYHEVCLVGMLADVLSHRIDACWLQARNLNRTESDVAGPSFYLANNLGKGIVSQNKEHHIVRTVVTVIELIGIGLAITSQAFFIAQDIAA